jgi:hypothetical protein
VSVPMDWWEGLEVRLARVRRVELLARVFGRRLAWFSKVGGLAFLLVRIYGYGYGYGYG